MTSPFHQQQQPKVDLGPSPVPHIDNSDFWWCRFKVLIRGKGREGREGRDGADYGWIIKGK